MGRMNWTKVAAERRVKTHGHAPLEMDDYTLAATGRLPAHEPAVRAPLEPTTKKAAGQKAIGGKRRLPAKQAAGCPVATASDVQSVPVMPAAPKRSASRRPALPVFPCTFPNFRSANQTSTPKEKRASKRKRVPSPSRGAARSSASVEDLIQAQPAAKPRKIDYRERAAGRLQGMSPEQRVAFEARIAAGQNVRLKGVVVETKRKPRTPNASKAKGPK